MRPPHQDDPLPPGGCSPGEPPSLPDGDSVEFDFLLSQARAGNRATMETLVVRHLAQLRAFVEKRAFRRFGPRESIDDLLQSTCREVLEDLHSFDDRGEGEAAFARWLCVTATRKILDRQRFHARQRRARGREIPIADRLDLEEMLRTSHAPSLDAEMEERRDRLVTAMQSLPPHYQHVLRLAYFEGMSRTEIAARLDKPSADAVQALLARALARLGTMISGFEG